MKIYEDTEFLTRMNIDPDLHWQKWNWKEAGHWQSRDFALMEMYRNRVVLAYFLYDRISFEHLKREASELSEDAVILDAGGGFGTHSLALAKMGFKNVTLFDLSPQWMELARESLEEEGFGNAVSLIEGDVKNMEEIADGSFDFAFALGGVISYCRGAEEALKEIYRVLKPSGKLLFNVHNVLFEKVLAIKSGLPETPAPTKDKAKPEKGIAIESFYPDEVEPLLKSIGFEDIKIMTEYAFVPDDSITRTPQTSKWEEAVIRAEIEHCRDPRFLASGMMIIECRRGIEIPITP